MLISIGDKTGQAEDREGGEGERLGQGSVIANAVSMTGSEITQETASRDYLDSVN